MDTRPSTSAPSGSSHPLRPYYSGSDDETAFVASAPRYSNAGPSSSSPAGNTSGPSSNGAKPGSMGYIQPGVGSSNRYSSTPFDSQADEAELAALSSGSAKDMARALLVGAAFQYTSTCLAMPFEVGKLLLQVQWLPRDDVWMAFGEKQRIQELKQQRQRRAARRSEKRQHAQERPIGRNEWVESEGGDAYGDSQDDITDSDFNASEEPSDPTGEDWSDTRPAGRKGRDFGGEEDELSDEDDAEAYFRDLSSTSARDGATATERQQRRRRTDASGYLMRKSVHEEVLRPEFVMPVVVRGGVWEMIKAVGRGKEGWFGLWKGSFTTFLMDTSAQTIQPMVTFVLSFFAPSAMTALPLPYAPYPYRSLGLLLTSHLVTGVILSPLDLVRTRLIAQSTLPPHRKYRTPFHALRQIINEEGGWRTTYFHPNLFIPTLLDFTLRPLLSLGTPLLIEYNLRLDPTTSPVRYSLAEFCISSASLLVTLPIETVRRRLQLQVRSAEWTRKQPVSAPAKGKQAVEGVHSLQSEPSNSKSFFSSFSSSIGARPRPLRTCVETRPVPYEGVCEALYRIVTEETSTSPVKKLVPRRLSSHAHANTQASDSAPTSEDVAAPASMMESGILAKQGYSYFGGLYSLYRGLGFAIGANALVFVLTIVTGERAHASAGWAEI